MTGFNHGLTGALIAITVKRPELAIPLAFVSHFATDLIPHWGIGEENHFSKKFNIVLVSDFILAVLIMIILAFMFPDKKWLIWACMIAVASPDLMWAYYRLYIEHVKKLKPRYDFLARFHHRIQWSQTARGAWVEAGWFVAMWAIILTIKFN